MRLARLERAYCLYVRLPPTKWLAGLCIFGKCRGKRGVARARYNLARY
jgi:hypothetical protein